MIASRTVAATFQGRNSLDLPVATIAALSVAFVVYAMPADLLSQLVESTGIAAFVSAAEPPLGATARIVIGSAAALAMFAGTYWVMRALDRIGADRSNGLSRALVSRESEPETEAPRLRRRDFHPDAPARRPLLATLELGDPQDSEQVFEQAPVQATVDRADPAPAWLQPAAFDLPAEVDEPAAPEPKFPPQPIAQAEPTPPPTRFSLDELMERLEQGLARRRVKVETIIADPVVVEPTDDRLQSAIDSLHRFAARQQD